MTNRLLLACAASLLAATSLSADVPFQPLASFGEGGGPTDMNAEGVIAGALTLDGRLEPVIWTSVTAQPTVLPTGGLGGAATAINSSGQVVGQIPAAFGGTPTIWENGVAISLPDLGEGGNARDVNESGMVAGYVIIKGNYRAARWVNRELQLLDVPAFGPPGATVWSFANSINSSGEITGTIEVPAGAESLALRWDAAGSVQPAIGTGTETSGISIDNIGGVLVNAYFDPNGAERPGRVLDGGVVDILPIPAGISYAWSTGMSRTGIVCGYYWDFSSTPRLKGVAWPGGVFTSLELPANMSYCVPQGVGINGVVIGTVSNAQGASIPGFWALETSEFRLQSTGASGARGATVELAAASLDSGAMRAGLSVAVRVDGAFVGRVVTDSAGVARLPFTIPSDFAGTAMQAVFTDETGASTTSMIMVDSGCRAGDLNCDGAVDSLDLAALLGAWGPCNGCGADLDGDGVVGSADIAVLLASWGA